MGTNVSYDADGIQFQSGSYTTTATDIDGYSTVLESQTIGVSTRGTIVVGNYTTTSEFDEVGGQTGSVTVGSSNNIKSKLTGNYTTTAVYGTDYNELKSQITMGTNVSYDADAAYSSSRVPTPRPPPI